MQPTLELSSAIRASANESRPCLSATMAAKTSCSFSTLRTSTCSMPSNRSGNVLTGETVGAIQNPCDLSHYQHTHKAGFCPFQLQRSNPHSSHVPKVRPFTSNRWRRRWEYPPHAASSVMPHAKRR
jgi:hypothetical protein